MRYGLNVAQPSSADSARTAFASDLSIGAGPGYGRVIDVGSKLRLARLLRVLRKVGLLNDDDIAPETARRLMQIWYSLRNVIGTYPQLGYTLQLLQEVNLISSAPPPAAVYRLVRILDDPQLLNRRQGFMFRAGYGFAHQLVLDADDRDLGFLYATGEWHVQRGTTRAMGVEGQFFWDHLTSGGNLSLNLEAYYDWFLYNRAFDPLGAIGVTLSTGVSDQPGDIFQDSGIAYQALAGARYQRFYNRGSSISATLSGGFDRRGGIVLLTVEASLGMAAGSVAAP